ncbi:Disks Large-Associated Protein 1 [Manis pentadactyla]|nr:Disks Large-Associated Protein 1 [Manis pentadactyla]
MASGEGRSPASAPRYKGLCSAPATDAPHGFIERREKQMRKSIIISSATRRTRCDSSFHSKKENVCSSCLHQGCPPVRASVCFHGAD